jgi:predicted MFS family arabinose efflux permease
LVFTSVIFAITKYFKARQGIALGIVIGGLNIGVMSLSPFIQLLLDVYGLKTMYRISTALFGFVLFIVLLLDPDVQDDIINQNQQNEHDGSLSKLFQLFKRPAYIIATVTISLETFTAFVSFIHLVSNMTDFIDGSKYSKTTFGN